MARIFAIAWVLVGLVITSIFTGVVTTSLTAITLSTDVKLYGTTVGSTFDSNVKCFVNSITMAKGTPKGFERFCPAQLELR